MFAEVIVDITNSEVDKIFEYSFIDGTVKVGSRVKVPFGNKLIEGIVINIKETSQYPQEKVKSVFSVLEETPALTMESLSLMNFMHEELYATRASILRLFLPSEMRKGRIKEKFEKYVNLAENANLESFVLSLRKSAIKQKEFCNFIYSEKRVKLSSANETFGASAVSVVIKKGFAFITEEQLVRSPLKQLNASLNKAVVLTESQNNAIKSITSTDKMVTLLHGVTGSGKTEVYLDLINKVIADGKSAIMLVPEIALTPQMLRQLRARFGDYAAILHSGLSAGERFDEWWRLRNGQARIAIGARSAIFAPLENVGLIVIDEEHDGSYISESNPRYSTLDIAEFRAKYNGAKIILGSATPSVESYLNAENGSYNLVKLPERINKKPLPHVEIVDMRTEIRRGNDTPFSSILKEELKACLEKGNQAIIFLNQRGYSKTIICAECGHVQKCLSCDVSLTYHKEDESLLCHYCGAKYKMIDACTECGSTFLRYGGVGTERVVSELKKLFPSARILRMDRDTTQSKEGHFEILNEFSSKNADILVGTQMIAKGHDFPSVTLVGILDADMSLHFSDYRSSERTFQLLTQVAGRSGRSSEAGKVVLQTYSPDHHVLRQAIAYDYDKFFRSEISIRKATAFPPFTDIIRLLVYGEDEEEVVNVTKTLTSEISEIRLKNQTEFRFLGCMKAPLKKLQNKYRYQVLMRINKNNKNIKDEIYKSISKNKSRTVLISMEINPNNLT